MCSNMKQTLFGLDFGCEFVDLLNVVEFSYLFVVDRSPNRFFVVHSLALSEKLNFLCAADREHNRIQCFDTELQWKYDVNFDKPVFAAAFKPNTGQYSATCIMSYISTSWLAQTTCLHSWVHKVIQGL